MICSDHTIFHADARSMQYHTSVILNRYFFSF